MRFSPRLQGLLTVGKYQIMTGSATKAKRRPDRAGSPLGKPSPTSAGPPGAGLGGLLRSNPSTIPGMSGRPDDLETAVNALVDEYRTSCLWFLRADYYPASDEQRARVLDYIQRHGDRRAYLRAATLRRWLSPTSSERSVAS